MNLKMNRKLFIILMVGVALLATFLFIPPALYSSPDGKYRIAMAGRSTMDYWFKSWNWPVFVIKLAGWKNLPIPHEKYAKDKYYFEYLPVPGPTFSDNPDENAREMFEAIARQADPKRYDALFFKFCYVDFPVPEGDEEARKTRLRQMKGMVEKVHQLAKTRGMKLILGTALPVLNPGNNENQLREELTDWIISYGKQNQDVGVVDLYKPIIDDQGKLRNEFAQYLWHRNVYDDHVSWKGFRVLDQGLFQSLDELFKNSPPRS